MTLPTGTITMGQVNTELGRSATATISLNETAVRTLAGVPSGTISMNDLRGKSNVVFTPDGGTTAGTAVALDDQSQLYSSITISCTVPAVWNYVENYGTGSASIASGNTDTSIIFQVDTVPFGGFKFANFTVNATAGGITRYWTVNLVAEDGS